MSQTLKSAIAVVGIDIGKNSFHVVGLEQRARPRVRRGQSFAVKKDAASAVH